MLFQYILIGWCVIEVILVWDGWDGNWDQTFLSSSSSGNNKVIDSNRRSGYGNREKVIKRAGSTFVRDQTQNVKKEKSYKLEKRKTCIIRGNAILL
jgi:hypothetical protein